jgi:hypothetical protein
MKKSVKIMLKFITTVNVQPIKCFTLTNVTQSQTRAHISKLTAVKVRYEENTKGEPKEESEYEVHN